MRRLVGAALAACALSGVSWAEVRPTGTEFRVNTYTTNSQSSPSVASDADGNLVMVWSSFGQDGSAAGVFGRRFDRSGLPLGSEFQVNTTTASYQDTPAVASDPAGNFVVVWQSFYQDGSVSGIFGRPFDRGGAPAGPEFQVNVHTGGYQEHPSIAADAAGRFMVVWMSQDQDGSGWGGFGRVLDDTGAPLSPEFQVNTFTTGTQTPSSVAGDAHGNFVVVWTSVGQDGSASGAFGRRFDASGTPLGPEFQVNTQTLSYQEGPSVASDPAGDFVVVWQSMIQDGSGWGVFGQRFDSAGQPAGPEFQVNTFTSYNQSSPSVATDAEGSFVVAWTSYSQDGSHDGVFGQRFDSAGEPTGPEFPVNTFTTSNQGSPSVASDAAGGFAVAWSSSDQDGSSEGVFGQRFFGRTPTFTDPLDGDTVDCSDPRVIRPTLTWDDDGYERFRVYIGWDPGFGTGHQVTSGDTLLRTTSWVPPVKKWRKACANAVAINPALPKLYVKVLGVDGDLPKSSPARKLYSDVVQVMVQP